MLVVRGAQEASSSMMKHLKCPLLCCLPGLHMCPNPTVNFIYFLLSINFQTWKQLVFGAVYKADYACILIHRMAMLSADTGRCNSVMFISRFALHQRPICRINIQTYKPLLLANELAAACLLLILLIISWNYLPVLPYSRGHTRSAFPREFSENRGVRLLEKVRAADIRA